MRGVPYPAAVRRSAVRRMLGPEGLSPMKVALELGIPHQTVCRWKTTALEEHWAAREEEGSVTSRPEDRTPEKKLSVVLAAHGLKGEELGALLRREGVHEAQLERWRAEALSGLAGQRPAKAAKPSRRIRKLERELARKEKALAEAAALLVLKKKARLLLGAEDDDTE